MKSLSGIYLMMVSLCMSINKIFHPLPPFDNKFDILLRRSFLHSSITSGISCLLVISFSFVVKNAFCDLNLFSGLRVHNRSIF